jgi:Domain of unknown function (DUF3883)
MMKSLNADKYRDSTMTSISLEADSRGYIYLAIGGLLSGGWRVKQIPEHGHLLTNRQLIQLVYPGHRDLFRLMIYSVSGSGRARPGERRIQITSTYEGGRLKPEADMVDVLLGYDPDSNVFVGFDSQRLLHGGPTENASAFISTQGLQLALSGEIVVLPRASALFEVEYHAFFAPPRLAEYLVNRSLIHSGAYLGGGPFSGRYRRGEAAPAGAAQVDSSAAKGNMVILEEPIGDDRIQEPNKDDLQSAETGRLKNFRSKKVTPEQFDLVLRAMARNGDLGEFLALEHERNRLVRARHADLAEKVRWTSKENVAAGFDISSFETDGSPRFIEVKASVGEARRFVITRNEWNVAQIENDRYWIYLVVNIDSGPKVIPLQNPVRLELEGKLVREANEWAVQVNKRRRSA